MITRARTCALLLTALAALAGCATPMGTTERTGGPADAYRGNETIAVLLPESGRFAGAAAAIRDGILAAQAADGQGGRPRLVFRDTGDGSNALALVQQAAAQGATLVIGPLQREAVDQLAVQPALPLPVLALNRATGGAAAPANLFQFSLAPEDEAAAAAEQAWEAGHRHALMLYPQSPWGERVAAGFRERWGVLGGLMLATRSYDPEGYDQSLPVTDLLDDAQAAPVAPDVLFLVATDRRAADIWPLVRERTGGLLPGFSTSHVHAIDGADDPALGELYYVDIPWLVAPSPGDGLSYAALRASTPDFQSQYARLYAMGIDAYRLAPRLTELAARPGATLEGKTGTLSLDSRRNVRRRLMLARIEPAPTSAATAPAQGQPAPAVPARLAALAAMETDVAARP